jgi:hypothetical protein
MQKQGSKRHLAASCLWVAEPQLVRVLHGIKQSSVQSTAAHLVYGRIRTISRAADRFDGRRA